jgi:hypothetical protein
MTQLRTFRATGPADLLALVPGLLGFHPEDSAVLMTVGAGASGASGDTVRSRGPGGGAGRRGQPGQPMHARIDLPPGAGDVAGIDLVVRQLAAVAARSGVRRCVLLLYTDDAGLAEAVADPLTALLAELRVEVVCAVRATDRAWWRVGAPVGQPGTPYDVRAHPFMAQMVMDGTVVLGSRRELAESLVGDDERDAAQVAAALAALAPRLRPGMVPAPGRPAMRARLVPEGHWVRHRVRRWVADRERLDAHDTARLAVATAASIEVRDVAWAEITHADAGAHVDLWRDVVRRVPASVRFAPATLLGFAAWLSGHGALAWCAVDLAQESLPGYGLAGLLADVLTKGMPPSVWKPLPPTALTLFTG